MAAITSQWPEVAIPDAIKSYPEFILNKCTEHGDLKAMVDSVTGRFFTYSQVERLSRQCGSALIRQGFQYKDTLAIILPNMIEYPIMLYGASAVGGVVTTMNPLYTVREMVYQLRDSGSKYAVTVPEHAEKVRQAATQSGVRRVFVLGDAPGCESFWSLVLKDDATAFPRNVRVDWKNDTALLLYSSGTTGLPKGVMLTHYNMISHQVIMKSVLMSASYPGQPIHAVQLLLLPLFHVSGASAFLGAMFNIGQTLVCMSAFDPIKFLEAVQKYKVTNLSLVPPLFLFVAKHPAVDKYDLSAVKEVICGAASLGESVINELKARLPNIYHVGQAYGLTESSPIGFASPIGLFRPASVGKVVPNVQAKVVDIKTGEALPAGKEGEICIKGPTIMKGYFNRPEVTAITIRDGWLHTGDLGYYDDEELFYVVGRLKELIKYKGYQVAPAELEDLLQSHPKIADAAVIGLPDTDAGELPKAFVVLKEGSHGITPQDIVQFVADNAVHYKRLRGGVEFVEAILKNASGKIMRRQLKEQELNKMKSQIQHKL